MICVEVWITSFHTFCRLLRFNAFRIDPFLQHTPMRVWMMHRILMRCTGLSDTCPSFKHAKHEIRLGKLSYSSERFISTQVSVWHHSRQTLNKERPFRRPPFLAPSVDILTNLPCSLSRCPSKDDNIH